MGRRVRFRGVVRTSKRLESDILERSKNLWADPEILRPKCAGDCRKCHFDKTFKHIAKLDKYKSSAEVLEKMASRGSDDILKAYAGTVSLYANGSVPYTATAKIAGEDVLYVPRGAVGNDKLIGCQHYNDPKLRLFLYNAFAKKKGLNLYSFGDDLVCSNHNNMPEDYIYDTFWETPYQFPEDGLDCGHSSESALVIRVKSADTEIRICKRCARKDVSTLQYLISRMISLNPLDDFEVRVEHNYGSGKQMETEPVPPETVKEYSLGKLNDSSLLNSVLRSKLGDLRSSGTSAYIVGTENYGSDLDRFLGDLKGEDIELRALSMYLPDACESIVVQTPRTSEVLSCIWEDSYAEILRAFTSEETAQAMGDVSKKNPLSVLKDAERMEISKDVVKALPAFKRLGPVGKLADGYVKAAKAGGFPLLRSELEKNPPREYRARAMAKAFAIAVGDAPDTVKTTAEEADLAQFLVPFVKNVMEADAENYKDRMNTLLTATGCGESVN